jgi:ribonuclease BN (tRNA processing enzyme)
VRLTVIGSSPAWPNPGGAHSGYLVEGSKRLLLDCGPGVLPRLRDAEGWPEIDAIAITHFHLDHWGDLVPWVWGTMYRKTQRESHPELWIPSTGRQLLVEIGSRLGFPDMFERTFHIHEYEGGRPFEVGDLVVTAIRVPHYRLETYAFRVQGNSSLLAYSGDSAPAKELVAAARDADLFVCEATLVDADSDGQPRGHLSADEAVAAFTASGARRLLITHRPEELDLTPELERAQDGLELDL